MKTFLAKLLLFCLPFLAALAAAAALLERLRREPLNRAVEEWVDAVRAGPEPEVVVAGDSKAEFQVLSPLLDSLASVRSVNIASGGCDLFTVVNALEKSGLIAPGRTFVISQSVGQINDNSQTPSNPSPSLLVNLTLAQWARLLAGNPENALAHLQKCGIALLRLALEGLGLDTSSPIRRAQAAARIAPVRVLTGKLPFEEPGALDPSAIRTAYYRDMDIHGVKREAFRKAIARMGASGGRFILYHGPMSPRWRAATRGSFVEAAEKEFSAFLAEEAAKHPNLVFVDLYAELADGIPEEMYHDPAHLNEAGARVFTAALSRHIQHELDQRRASGASAQARVPAVP